MTLKEGAFFPAPRVKSSVIKLKRNAVGKLDCDEALLFRVVKTAFNQRRKTLRNALSTFRFEDLPEEGILQRRAEQLTGHDFVLLTRSIRT